MGGGLLYILSSPAGGGKTTIANILLSKIENLKRVITYTTREKRPNEIDGVDYYFVGKDKFEKLIKENAFLEYAIVHGNYYGTPKKETLELLRKGYDLLLVIDVQGYLQIKQNFKEAVGIFILPPSINELINRMKKRGETEEEINKRLKTAEKEIPQWKNYDYIIINENLDDAVEKAKSIIISNRLKTDRFDISNIKDEKLKILMQNMI
ncbi:guanylate kinase [Venenivibrio stagnispumantis]|uniref:Guanylate kinase n=1 Tax=Venenivibrio stagnispumantis TaxID=407998 RepID=A0AA45WJ31_9AQUI|nr:guanylate kinase [Venenivibrio stagnispumantis]MCW4572528.1 guanylate kinase [Venenivibrio stagnispumantis]SMP01785.1 guanylate kinase [Venenivibrio stagnispumantis]